MGRNEHYLFISLKLRSIPPRDVERYRIFTYTVWPFVLLACKDVYTLGLSHLDVYILGFSHRFTFIYDSRHES